jgi:L,D-peptidoglycan transpeptidase YkuD (ErfK/YbiS/YcfS/YnhG family)
MRLLALTLCGAAVAGCTTHHPTSSVASAAAASVPSQPAPTSAPALSASAAPASVPSEPATPASATPASATPASVAPVTPAAAAASTSAPPTPTPAVLKPPTPTPTATTKPAPPPAAPLLVSQLADVGNAQQAVIVTSTSWSSTAATVQTFEKDAGGWHAVFAPMASLIGRGGFSANRTEGDGTTPTGKYSFGTMFGQQPSPGVKFAYRQPDAQSVWVDDNASPYYNSWQENAALSGEHLASSGYARAYAYAAVINFNMSPVVPHKGSAIFLHVSTGNPTAGCVSVAQSNLLEILRWLDPARDPVIVMGPTSVIRTY